MVRRPGLLRKMHTHEWLKLRNAGQVDLIIRLSHKVYNGKAEKRLR